MDKTDNLQALEALTNLNLCVKYVILVRKMQVLYLADIIYVNIVFKVWWGQVNIQDVLFANKILQPSLNFLRKISLKDSKDLKTKARNKLKTRNSFKIIVHLLDIFLHLLDLYLILHLNK